MIQKTDSTLTQLLAQIYVADLQVDQLEKEVAQLRAENDQLKAEIAEHVPDPA